VRNVTEALHTLRWAEAPAPRAELARAEQALAAAYTNSSYEHYDLHRITGKVEPLHSVIVGATVYPDALDPTVVHHRLVAQANDGTTRLIGVSELAHHPASTETPSKVHAPTTLWLPKTASHREPRLKVTEKQLEVKLASAAGLSNLTHRQKELRQSSSSRLHTSVCTSSRPFLVSSSRWGGGCESHNSNTTTTPTEGPRRIF